MISLVQSLIATAPLVLMILTHVEAFHTVRGIGGLRKDTSCSSSWSILRSTVIEGPEPSASHSVEGIRCVEVKASLPIGDITILEATADSQEDLVNWALDDNEQPEEMSTTGLAHADPYGAVLWPAATAVARAVLMDPNKWLKGKIVCELGAGTGLVSLGALAGGASKVIATDYEQIPLKLLEYAQKHLNAGILPPNACRIETQLLDLCQHGDTPLPQADIYLAADVMYEPQTGKALAHRVVEALSQGAHVLIGDSPGRAGRPAFLEQLRKLGVPGAKFVNVPGWTVTGDRHDLICGETSTTVSKEPKQLMVALMELDPEVHRPVSNHS